MPTIYFNPPTSPWQGDRIHQFPNIFSSDAGYRLLSCILSEEHKLLQDIKKIIDKRVTIDEQYAKNLQELKASADRIVWPTTTHPVATACRDLFEQWSQIGTFINSNAERFKRDIINGLLKELIEQKHESKKHLEEEKRRYDVEHRKAQSDLADADRHYSDQGKSYITQHQEYKRINSSNARPNDEVRLKRAENTLIGKKNDLHRVHNEYTFQLHKHNFVNEQYVKNIKDFLVYHEEAQFILNMQWKKLLENLVKYTIQNQNDLKPIIENSQRIIQGVDPIHCYDELCRLHSNILPITVHPQTFNELLIDATLHDNLRINEFVCDDATIADIRQRIESLKTTLNESNTQLATARQAIDQIKDADTSYPAHKTLFEQAQCAEYLQAKMNWENRLMNDLEAKRTESGYLEDDPKQPTAPETSVTNKLEDQNYFHGVLPRSEAIKQLSEKGDFLVRINDEHKPVLSLLWIDPNDQTRLKDSHFFIYENGDMYSFQPDSVSKPSIKELISYYIRGGWPLRDDGTKLLRPVDRPSYIIKNDEVRTFDMLGKGNFGQVVRGEYRGQAVAVKILHSATPNRSPEDQKKFIQEALLLKRYKHKNIVKFIGVAGFKSPLMIVMELVEKGSLSNYVKKTEISPPQLIQFCYEIAKGMAYLEECRVIHRDLAARNCLVDKTGMAKVADFGLSRCLQNDEEYFSNLKEVPTRWWAIEVFSKAPYTHKSDVWSYGITAWEIFSRADIPYWHLQANYLVIDAIKRGERLQKPDKCPANIFKIMFDCWLANPEDRPTFQQLVEILHKHKPSKLARAIPFLNSN